MKRANAKKEPFKGGYRFIYDFFTRSKKGKDGHTEKGTPVGFSKSPTGSPRLRATTPIVKSVKSVNTVKSPSPVSPPKLDSTPRFALLYPPGNKKVYIDSNDKDQLNHVLTRRNLDHLLYADRIHMGTMLSNIRDGRVHNIQSKYQNNTDMHLVFLGYVDRSDVFILGFDASDGKSSQLVVVDESPDAGAKERGVKWVESSDAKFFSKKQNALYPHLLDTMAELDASVYTLYRSSLP
jgi:hypothetical protein